ncbi:MAG: LEA type 2 family protein [Gemmatimonadaceae bacterium]
MRSLLLAAAVASVAASIACGSSRHDPPEPLPPFDQPAVSLRDVRLAGVGITGGSMDLELGVYNPNFYDLEQPRVTYRVFVDDTELGDGIYDADVTVLAEDSATVTMPMSFSYLSVGRAGRALLDRGAVNYRVIGHITVGTPYGRIRFPYDRVGRFATLTAQRSR